jgi:hypothetical protein
VQGLGLRVRLVGGQACRSRASRAQGRPGSGQAGNRAGRVQGRVAADVDG